MFENTTDTLSDFLSHVPERICDVITRWAELSPNRQALVESSGTWTYRELSSVMSETQRWLIDFGIRPGDRVLIVCENCLAFVAVLLALAGIDAWRSEEHTSELQS